MTKPLSYNEKNCEDLAELLIEAWDINNLKDYAFARLVDQYMSDKAAFDNDAFILGLMDEEQEPEQLLDSQNQP